MSQTPDLQCSIVRVQVGRLQTLADSEGELWTTAIHKQAVLDPVEIVDRGLAGDEHTGGRIDYDRAICCHPIAHYRFWTAYFRREFPLGIFGENLTLNGMMDEDLCIGDVFQCGTAILQVTQPRTPCYKQSKRLNIPNFVKLIEQTNRRGFLLRVLQPGWVQVGDSFTLLERPCPDAPLLYVNTRFFDRDFSRDYTTCRWLADLSPLARDWREKAEQRATQEMQAVARAHAT